MIRNREVWMVAGILTIALILLWRAHELSVR
jgi:hypothetical protein